MEKPGTILGTLLARRNFWGSPCAGRYDEIKRRAETRINLVFRADRIKKSNQEPALP